jgi:FKBP-type peptidyl-prolyl cis-trans isomerase
MRFTLAALLTVTTRGFSTTSRRPSTFLARSCVRTFAGSSAQDAPHPEEKMPLYALGTNLAMQVGGQGAIKNLLEDDELDIVLQGFCETMKGTNSMDARTVLETYGEALNKMVTERSASIADRVKKDGEDFSKNFIECNEEAIVTESGMVYYEMTAGSGATPTPDSTVEVHYHGSLTDGSVFDSSVDRGQTISFPLNGVIQGWQEGLLLMKEGGKATLIIPSDLAYGDGGSGEKIPPGATLKFEVELIKVN